MAATDKKIVMSFDWPLLIVVLTLNIVGLINLASAAPEPSFVHRQWFSFLISLSLMGLAAGVHYRFFERSAYIIYGFSLFLLMIVVLFFRMSWIRIGPLSLQPSELMKIGTILALAKYFHEQRVGGPYGFRQLINPIMIGVCPAIMIMLEPDMGTAVMTMLIVGGMILFVGVRRRLLIVGVLLVIITAPLSWNFMALHQKNRILNFVDPYRDPTGTGYNVIQSMVSVGSGRLSGKGYKLGSQTALQYLPARHTDFVYSVLGEEWGFIGCTMVLVCFLFLLIWGLKISAGAKDRFGALTALGVVLMIFFHVTINVAMTLGAFPVIGIPLPFMSYGGSSLLTVMMGIGLLMSIEERKWMF